MTPERARELLGGLAAGILTPEERKTLFEAALHDQALFNEVADELELAVFLQSPETRAQLANRIEVEPERRRWWAMRPGWLALSGVVAASIVVFVAISHRPVEVSQLSVTAPKGAAPIAAPATESAGKEAEQAPSKVMPGPKTATPRAKMAATMARSAEEAKLKAAAAEAGAIDSVAEKPPESRDQRLAEQSRSATRGMMAAPMAPQTATVTPPAAPPVPQGAAPARQAVTGTVTAGALLDKTIPASLTGAVHDFSGAPIAGAKVDIVNTSTNTTIHAATDANGRFIALSLPQGLYTVTANNPGFVMERRSIAIDGNQPAQIDIPLRVGEVSETVIVTSAASNVLLNQKDLLQNLSQVAVLDFVNGNQKGQSGAQIADQLSNQLLNSGQVRVIDRDKVQQAAQSQSTTGRPPNAQEAAALGRSIGADAVILGSVQAPDAAGGGGALSGFAQRKAKAAPNVSVMAEIIDTKKATPVVTVSADAASLQGATNILGNKIQARLAQPVEGSVTHLTGDVVSVAFAAPPGLQAGAHCEVIRGTQKIGELVITSVNGASAFGKFTGTSQPRIGDRVTASR